MRKHRYLDEHDRDLFEIELAEESALAKREYARWLEAWTTPVVEQPRDDGYDENDPYDRLKREGGHLSE